MKIALDPYMHRHLSLEELPRKAAELGYEWIELSPRDDFLDWWVAPRVYPERIASFKKALKDHGVKIASLLPMYRWSSPHEDERQSGDDLLEEGDPDRRRDGRRHDEFASSAAAPRPIAAILPIAAAACYRRIERSRVVALDGGTCPGLEKEGVQLNIEPHPGGLVRDPASRRRHDPHHRLEERQIPVLRAAYVLFRRRHGQDGSRSRRLLAHVHVADTYNHKASSGLRYICNPPGARVTIHQHMDIGQGEIDWDVFFSSLAAVGFDGIMTSCVFAWEERADQSGRYMRETMQKYVDKYWARQG